jgi:hypothetical protein
MTPDDAACVDRLSVGLLGIIVIKVLAPGFMHSKTSVPR